MSTCCADTRPTQPGFLSRTLPVTLAYSRPIHLSCTAFGHALHGFQEKATQFGPHHYMLYMSCCI